MFVLFNGEVINSRNIISFEERTIQELSQTFQDSVGEYTKFYVARGKEPEKHFPVEICGSHDI